jgi:hypothetical protein
MTKKIKKAAKIGRLAQPNARLKTKSVRHKHNPTHKAFIYSASFWFLPTPPLKAAFFFFFFWFFSFSFKNIRREAKHNF